MSQLTDNAGKMMRDAVQFETAGDLSKALKAYADAITCLKAALQYEKMLPEQKTRLQQYVTQVDGKIAHLVVLGVKLPQSAIPPGAAPTAGGQHAPTPAASAPKSNIQLPSRGTSAPLASQPKLGGWRMSQPAARPATPPPAENPSDPAPKPTPTAAENPMQPAPPLKPSTAKLAPAPKPASKGPADLGPSPFVGNTPSPSSGGGGGGGKISPPPAPSESAGDDKADGIDGPKFSPNFTAGVVGNKYAPRASELVLRALEKATALVKQKQLKQAIDILQHAIDEGSRESHNPANFSTLTDTMKELKKKYQVDFPPRWLQTNQPTPGELEILRRAGRTDRMLLPIWDDLDDGYATENVYLPCKQAVWEDAWLPTLEKKQKEAKAEWGRPCQWALEELAENSSADPPVILRNVDPMSIRQTLVGDCSLVCSLIVCAGYQKRFPNGNILGKVIFPQDSEGNPIVSRRGKYCVKMLVNGVTRLIAVDDRLPYTEGPPKKPGGKPTRTLLCTYSKDPTELWVSLMEKAFIKVCGGSYDFPGSQSSADLYKLCGWLPDLLALDEEGFDGNHQWAKLSMCHEKGRLLATLSTPAKLDPIVEEKLKLVEGHAYAILEFREIQGNRLVKIKNPWAKQSWQGMFSVNDENRCTEEMMAELQFSEEESAQGVFWMSWQDVIRFFSRAHLSWNPYLLFPSPTGGATKPTRIACHANYVHNQGLGALPQFHLQTYSPRGRGRLHVVLSRHIRTSKEYSINSDLEGKTLVPFITLHVYNVTQQWSAIKTVKGEGGNAQQANCGGGTQCRGRRVYHGMELPDECCIKRGVYKNLPNQTVSFDVPEGGADFVVVVSEHKAQPNSDWSFSLTLHSNLPMGPQGVVMHEIPMATLPFATKKSSGWKKGSSCGGPIGKQTFAFNPQFRFSLPQPAHVTARIQSHVDDPIMCNVARLQDTPAQQGADGKAPLTLPWHGRLSAFPPREISLLLQFPAYVHGCAAADSSIAACYRYNSHKTESPVPEEASPPPQQPQQGPPPHHLSVAIKMPRTPGVEIPGVVDVDSKLEEVYTLIMGSKRILCSPSCSKVVCNKAQVADPGEATFGQYKPAMEPGKPLGLVVLPMTEEIPRSQELTKVENQLLDLAQQVLTERGESLFKKEHGEGRGVAPSGKREMVLKGLSEAAMSLQLQLDGAHCPTDAIKATRKVLVMAGQCIQRSVDFLLKPLPPLAGGGIAPVQAKPAKPTKTFFGERLPAGEYTIVASTWKKGTPGAFDLILESESEEALKSLEEIPAEGAGYTTTTIQGGFTTDNNCGPSTVQSRLLSDRFHKNPFVEIKLPRKGIVTLRLLSLAAGGAQGSGADEHDEPETQIILFKKVSNNGDEVEPVATSGRYDSCTGITKAELQQGVAYRAVLSTTVKGNLKFVIYVHASCDPELCELRNCA